MKIRSTLPTSMKKVDMIEEYEILYHNYKNKEEMIENQAMYIEILMDMLLEEGVSQKEINEILDGNKVFCRMEILRKERIYSNILNEKLKVKDHDIMLLENKIKRLESRDRPRKVLEVSEEEYKESGYKYSCPRCGMLVGTISKGGGLEHDDYCCSCGQRLQYEKER